MADLASPILNSMILNSPSSGLTSRSLHVRRISRAYQKFFRLSAAFTRDARMIKFGFKSNIYRIVIRILHHIIMHHPRITSAGTLLFNYNNLFTKYLTP